MLNIFLLVIPVLDLLVPVNYHDGYVSQHNGQGPGAPTCEEEEGGGRLRGSQSRWRKFIELTMKWAKWLYV